MEETARNKKIEDFLMGRLEEADMQAFRAEMEQDPELKADVKNYQQMMKQIDALYDRQASKLIKKVQHDAKQQKPKGVSIRRRINLIIGIAAAIALLFVVVDWFSGPSNSDLYRANYQAYDLPFAQRGEADERVVDAGTYYRSEDYTNALPMLKSILIDNPKDTRTRLAIGICQLELEQYKEAIQSFQPLIQNQDALYLHQAHWYTALAHLQLDEIDLCKEQLLALSTSLQSLYKQKAVELLDELD